MARVEGDDQKWRMMLRRLNELRPRSVVERMKGKKRLSNKGREERREEEKRVLRDEMSINECLCWHGYEWNRWEKKSASNSLKLMLSFDGSLFNWTERKRPECHRGSLAVVLPRLLQIHGMITLRSIKTTSAEQKYDKCFSSASWIRFLVLQLCYFLHIEDTSQLQ